MRIYDVLYSMNTGNASPKASPFDNLLGQALGGEVEKTTTGNPVSIVTSGAQNAISTILSFSPKQSGSGDPSPINIRPFVPWTEANLGVNSETPTLTISLGGTYYGFSVDIERGVLRSTWGIMDLGSRNWTFRENGTTQFFESGTIADKAIGNFNVICDIYKTSTSTVVSGMGNYEIKGNASNRALYIKNPDYTDGDVFKTAMQGKYVSFELAEPIELPLTPQTVALLAGNNTLWTDGDEISITYKAKRV